MKNRFIRMLSILCAIMLMTGVVSVWASAEEMAATPTDLPTSNEEEVVVPEEKPEEEIAVPEDKEDGPDEEDNEPESPVDGVEVIITKSVRLGETWEGVTRNTKLTVLKLDLDKAQTIHLIVEGKNAWANIRKAEQCADNLRKVETDSETKRVVITLDAEAGSYLITIGPVEPNMMAKVKATVLDNQAFAAWEAALESVAEEAEEEPAEETESEPAEEQPEEPEIEPAEGPAEEPAKEPEEEPGEVLTEEQEKQDEDEKTEIDITKERHITVDVSWDVPDPVIGDTAHLKAVLEGYDDLEYTMQWQYGPDKTTWFDIPGETGPVMDVVVTEENNVFYWRILVYVEDGEKD